ncbi:MAG: N-formylglutamate amidohydrolase [Rhizobiaceae bacterium]
MNEASDNNGVLVCEHAGRKIPTALGNLGVREEDMQRHIACEPGAAGIDISMADILDTPLLLQHNSRLVVDCNRQVHARDADAADAIKDHPAGGRP